MRSEICVGGVGVTRSMMMVAGDLSSAAVVHASRGRVREMADVEHRAGGWHGIHEVSSNVDRATLQTRVGKTTPIALHGVVVILSSRVSFLLRQTAAERSCVGSQAIQILLRLGKGGW